VRRVLPETKFENKWTLFFEFFDLSDLYIFEHLSLHIYFRAFKPSYTFLWVGRVLPEAKLKNKCTLFFELFLFDRPLLTRDWKSESVTNLLTYQPTNLLTWVGAIDTCVSKNMHHCTMRSLFSRMPLYPIFLGVFWESGLGPFIKVIRWPWFSFLKYLKNKPFFAWFQSYLASKTRRISKI